MTGYWMTSTFWCTHEGRLGVRITERTSTGPYGADIIPSTIEIQHGSNIHLQRHRYLMEFGRLRHCHTGQACELGRRRTRQHKGGGVDLHTRNDDIESSETIELLLNGSARHCGIVCSRRYLSRDA